MIASATGTSARIGVDTDNRILHGIVLAQTGRFETGRGQFTLDSLRKGAAIMRSHPYGTRSYFQHGEDQLGRLLGRIKNTRVEGDVLRGDLHLGPTSMQTPPVGGRPLGEYVLQLATTDPDAMAASLVLEADKVNPPRGSANLNSGKMVPVWHPTSIFSADLVSRGDASRNGLFGLSAHDEIEALRQKHRLRQLEEDEFLRIRWRHRKRMAGLV
jgi:hypothetical protein